MFPKKSVLHCFFLLLFYSKSLHDGTSFDVVPIILVHIVDAEHLEEPFGVFEAVPAALLLLHQQHRRRRRRRLFLFLLLLFPFSLRQRQLQHLLESQANRPTGAPVLDIPAPMIGVARRRVRLLTIAALLPPPGVLARSRLLVSLRVVLVRLLLGHRPSGLHEGIVDANRSRQRRSLLDRR